MEHPNTCPICNDAPQDETKTFVCNHSFCQTCLVTWYTQCVNNDTTPTCPLCRKVDTIWGT